MIAKCANPACRTRFDHRIGGKFFRFHLQETAQPDAAAPIHNTHNVVHYWLCPVCSKIFTLVCDHGGRVVLHFVELEFTVAASQHEFSVA